MEQAKEHEGSPEQNERYLKTLQEIWGQLEHKAEINELKRQFYANC